MLKFVDFLSMEVQRAILAEHDYFEVSSVDAKKLNDVGQGNHIYLTFSYPRADRHEVVKYEHGNDWVSQGGLVKIPVVRGVLGKRLSFPATSCVKADMNSVQLAEFIRQHKN